MGGYTGLGVYVTKNMWKSRKGWQFTEVHPSTTKGDYRHSGAANREK